MDRRRADRRRHRRRADCGGPLPDPAAVPAAGAAGGVAPVAASEEPQVPKKSGGRTGLTLSALGIGGYHLGTAADQGNATKIVNRALDAGVNFFDNAWEYHEGESEIRLGEALKGKRDQAIVMTKVCTHGRGKDVAMRMLEESLRRLQTDYLDVWQIHEVIYYNDPDLFSLPAARPRRSSMQRNRARSGLSDSPGTRTRRSISDAVAGFPFDTVQMPLNCFDATFHSFETQVLPEANKRGWRCSA